MYCSSMWFDSTVTSMKKIKIAYNNGLRRLVDLPKYNSAFEMFVHLNILFFGEPLQKSIFGFRKNIYKLGQLISSWYCQFSWTLDSKI